MEQIDIYIKSDDMLKKALDKYNQYIKSETLAVNIVDTEEDLELFDLNGHNTGINVIKK